ncbi:GMC family oxidoreductase [Bacillus sp. BP-3]|uniref:GMC family oxidoreductase n=1 Tax=Bacillus sp. BP-3 TaxID=3022773 RepID=UPI00232E07AA|nr:GMC family oxidoreductase [Bacillus sp. BP-3]MDC2864322.1 GMC family oxidoreductase [Bacillus sp. BP-3]
MPLKNRGFFIPVAFPIEIPEPIPEPIPKPIQSTEQTGFDYIVIGAGTAGGVIAKELTDDKSTSVLVLDAGANMTNELSGASITDAINLASDNKFTFNVTSNLEKIIERPLFSQNGRGIGGSSSINNMYAVRGSKELYDKWGELVGDQWSYNKIRSLFMKNETYIGGTQCSNERGTEGPIFVRQQLIPPHGLIETLTNATAKVLGIDIVEDYNTGVRDCTFYKSQYTQQEKNSQFVRSSTATGYLNDNIVSQGDPFRPDGFGVDGRKLVILAETTVNKILFKEIQGLNIAVGVEFVKNGISQRRFARKGIIVSAGFFSSVILQRSGIGRSCDLAKAGISTLIESPNVGYNLQTHAYVGLGVRVETSQLVSILSADPDQPIALGAFKAENPASLEGRRLQMLGAPVPLFLPIQEVISNGWNFDGSSDTNIMSFGILDLNPKSKGTIMAAHSNLEAPPSLTFNPLQNRDDLDFLLDQYINTYNIIQHARTLNNGIGEVVYPPENIFKTGARKQLENYVRASYSNFFHFGGQCKMGRTIQEGVVDGFLNVFGTKNLKVADLSISPILPDGNTSIAAQMIGLNAVRFIREDPHPYVVDDKEFENYKE